MGNDITISEETARSLLESRGYQVSVPLPKLERLLRARAGAYMEVSRSFKDSITVVNLKGDCMWAAIELQELIDWLIILKTDVEKHNG